MNNENARAFKGYRASKNADGTWNIFDVPIYAANVRDFGLMPAIDKKTGEIVPEQMIVAHDAEWLGSAIATAQLDYEERGYRAPLHIHHHGKGEKVEEAGEIMPRYVKKTLYEGKLLDTLFADLHNVPNAAYEMIKARRLRYRSVECPMSMKDRPEIKSLALLPHQPPHFKLPPLVVDEAQTLVGAYAGKTGVQMLSLFEADTEDPELGKRTAKMGDEPGEATGHSKENGPKDQIEGAGKVASAQDEDTKSKGGFMDKILLLLTALCAKMGIGADDSQSAMHKGPAEQPRGEETKDPLKLAAAYEAKIRAAAASAGALPVASIDPSEWMAIKAQNAAFQARFEAMDSDKNAKTAVDTALAKLKGRNITDKMRADLLEAAKLGEKPLAMYVSVIESSVPMDPPASVLPGFAAPKEGYPAEVLAYQAQGEDALQKAVECWGTYKALGARVSGRINLADFLKTNVSAELGVNFFTTAN